MTFERQTSKPIANEGCGRRRLEDKTLSSKIRPGTPMSVINPYVDKFRPARLLFWNCELRCNTIEVQRFTNVQIPSRPRVGVAYVGFATKLTDIVEAR